MLKAQSGSQIDPRIKYYPQITQINKNKNNHMYPQTCPPIFLEDYPGLIRQRRINPCREGQVMNMRLGSGWRSVVVASAASAAATATTGSKSNDARRQYNGRSNADANFLVSGKTARVTA